MVLTDREEVINIARNVDEETLGLTDNAKLLEMVDAAIEKGKGSAAAWAPTVTWATATSHPLYSLYKKIYQIYAAIDLIMRFPETDKDLKSLTDLIEVQGALLSTGVKTMATLGTDGGTSKVRATSAIAANITYPKNTGALSYRSPAFLNGRRGRY